MSEPVTSSRLEWAIGRLLWFGVGLSTGLLAVGLLLRILAPDLGTVASTLLNVGLIVLMATPATRVVLAFAEFARSREWFFALASLGVLAVLAMTVWVAFGGR